MTSTGGRDGYLLDTDRLRHRRAAVDPAAGSARWQQQAPRDPQAAGLARWRQVDARAVAGVHGLREHRYEAEEVLSDNVGYAAAIDGPRSAPRQGRIAQAKPREEVAIVTNAAKK